MEKKTRYGKGHNNIERSKIRFYIEVGNKKIRIWIGEKV